MLRALVEAGSCPSGAARRAPRIPTASICRWCSREEPPREGVRPRPRRAAGRQRQGPHPGLRARLERQKPASQRQHKGPITRAFLEVLEALLWGFHNSPVRLLLPDPTKPIAAKAECARTTVAEALKALEWAGVLTWQHRITRIREACTDLFGRHGWPLAGHPHLQRLRVPRPESSEIRPFCFQVRKSDGNSEPRDLILLSWRQRSTRTAHWSALWPDSVP